MKVCFSEYRTIEKIKRSASKQKTFSTLNDDTFMRFQLLIKCVERNKLLAMVFDYAYELGKVLPQHRQWVLLENIELYTTDATEVWLVKTFNGSLNECHAKIYAKNI